MKPLCKGKVKLTKKLQLELGKIEDDCYAYGTEICEDCGKNFCHNHRDRDKHECDDSIKGCHGTLDWKNESKKLDVWAMWIIGIFILLFFTAIGLFIGMLIPCR